MGNPSAENPLVYSTQMPVGSNTPLGCVGLWLQIAREGLRTCSFGDLHNWGLEDNYVGIA